MNIFRRKTYPDEGSQGRGERPFPGFRGSGFARVPDSNRETDHPSAGANG